MISNARPPIGTGTPRARSSRRARSTSHPPDSYTSCRPCARTRGPCSGFLTFYQNSAAREPPGPVPSSADGHCCTCVVVGDRLPAFLGKACQFLRNTQLCFKEWIRIARIEHRSGMAYRIEIFHLVGLPSLEPGEFSQSRKLRVRQADGVANDQSCTEALASQSP